MLTDFQDWELDESAVCNADFSLVDFKEGIIVVNFRTSSNKAVRKVNNIIMVFLTLEKLQVIASHETV